MTRPGVALLRFAWNNDEYAADFEYLWAVARAAERARGPVLECGSGLSTMLLSLIAQRRGLALWVLEHDPAWEAMVRQWVDMIGAPSVAFCIHPLQSYGTFDWYALPSPMPVFDLVICDGPPGSTRGGRYGLLSVAGAHLSSDCVIILDDAQRQGERETLARWGLEYGVAAEIRGDQKQYAIVRRTVRPLTSGAED